jgi:hypothetical protein
MSQRPTPEVDPDNEEIVVFFRALQVGGREAQGTALAGLAMAVMLGQEVPPRARARGPPPAPQAPLGLPGPLLSAPPRRRRPPPAGQPP